MVRKKKSMDLGVGMRDKEAAMKDHNKRLPQMPLLDLTVSKYTMRMVHWNYYFMRPTLMFENRDQKWRGN